MKKIKVFETFSGYGSQSLALKYIDIPFEIVAISEIDKYAIKAHAAIHGEVNNLGDISKINLEDVPTHDLFTYSFPCQDISVAGKGLGLDKKSRTRSGMLWECERIIEHYKPKYLLMENVKNLLSKKHKPNFDNWCKCLEDLGYTNYYDVLNSKYFGVPQSRERIFMISILGEHKPYEFPKGFELNKKLKDLLEVKVDDKYYLSEDIQKRFKPIVYKNIKKEDVIKIGNSSLNPKSQAGKVISIEGLSMTLCAGTHGYAMGYIYEDCKIRRFTPKECFRLQGMKNNDINKIQNVGISDTQQYKMSGNSITIPVLEHIFKNLFTESVN